MKLINAVGAAGLAWFFFFWLLSIPLIDMKTKKIDPWMGAVVIALIPALFTLLALI